VPVVDGELNLEDRPDGHELRWSGAARSRYQSAAKVMLDALAAHVDLVAGGTGDPSELGPYLRSTKRLVPIVDAFRRAEYDLCGEFPMDDFAWPQDEADLDLADDPTSGHRRPGPIVSVVHRMEFEVLDEAQLLAAGRAAHRQAWVQEQLVEVIDLDEELPDPDPFRIDLAGVAPAPDDDRPDRDDLDLDDAELEDVGGAVAALLQTHGPAGLGAGQSYLARRWTEISVLQRDPADLT
jgi:hypothetical protein